MAHKPSSIILYGLLLAALSEMLVRAFFPGPWLRVRDRGFYPFGAGDLPPSREFIEKVVPTLPYYVKTSSLGTRDSGILTWEKPAGTIRIAALGDSFTFGSQVNNHETWPAQLENALQRQAVKAQVVNLGVPGYTVEDEFNLLRDKAGRLHPDLILVAFYGNDIADFAPAQRAAFRRRVAIRPWTAAVYRVREWAKRSALISTVQYFKHQGRARAAFRHIQDDENRLRPDGVQAFRREYVRWLVRTIELAQARGQHLAWVFFPYHEELEKDLASYIQSKNEIKNELDKAGVKYLDLLPALRAAGDAEELYFMPEEWHMAAYGYLVAGREIASFIRREFPNLGLEK